MSTRPLSRSLALASLVLVSATAGCMAGAGGSASASATVSVKTGHFFGHDLRRAPSVVYVLDLSGSMSESSGTIVEQVGTDAAASAAGGLAGGLLGRGTGRAVEHKVKSLKKKIEKVKLHLMASLQGLPEGATFNLILFADGVQQLAPGMIVANGFSTTAVTAFVSRLEEGGSTNMYAAIEAALYTPAAHIIVLTDGLPTSSSPDDVLDLIARHNDGRRVVSTVGVGGDQAREFLATMAAENNGTYQMYY